ncbi:putative pteridine transporter [Novymonas esmeraldas]|uniref:Pteridine transporter n=1 Tax=Novymonas esmeraldas TaxID=1808958 RepID=A0AAW0EXC8_9TRYP
MSASPSLSGSAHRGSATDDGEPCLENSTSQDTYVHPDAAAMFHAMPCTRHIPVFSKSCEGYGPRCVSALGLCYFLNKGLGNNLMSYSLFAMFRDRFGIDGTRYQRLSGITRMGWSVKAFSACISDAFALFGYTKRWYCAGSSIIGGVFALAFALLPAKTSSADIAAGFLFLSNFCMANIDILSEGHYSRLMREHPGAGPELVSWIWWFILGATIVSAAIQGPLSEKGIPQVGLFVSAACQALSGVIFLFNFYGEQHNRGDRLSDAKAMHEELYRMAHSAAATPLLPSPPLSHEHAGTVDGAAPAKELNPEAAGPKTHLHEPEAHQELEESTEVRAVRLGGNTAEEDEQMWADFKEPQIISYCCGAVEFNKEVCIRNWRILVYSAVMVCSVVAMTCVTILGHSMQLFYCAIVVAVVNCGLSFWATQLVIAKAIVFIYLHMVLYIQINGAMDSFYMAKKECLVDGPHFDYVFYTTVGAIIGNVGGIAGVTAFSYIFAKHTYPLVFIVTTTIQVLASIFDIVIVKRWNMAIGIPDHAMYIMGDSIVYQVCYYLAWMPIIVLISRVCPRGSESMIYALVAGFAQLGSGMSGTFGSILLEKAWPIVSTGVGTCDFSNLPMLLLVGHLLLPLLVVPLSFLLLPRVRICDDIDVDGTAVKEEAKRREQGDRDASAMESAEQPFSEPSEQARS